MTARILVPLDGSRFSEQALPLARRIAERADGSLHLVQVHVPIWTSYVEGVPIVDRELDAASRANTQTYLALLTHELAAGGVAVTGTVLDGAIAPSIAHEAEELRVDMIVMTTHGRGGLARLWLGSTVDGLVHHSHIPILLLHPDETSIPDDAPPPLQRIAVLLDGSPMPEQILAPALALGSLFEASYTLIQIVDVGRSGGVPDMVRAPELGPDMVRQREQAAYEYLEHVAARIRRSGARVQTRVLVELQPTHAILHEIETQPYDLVTLATHGRTGLPRLLAGSVADKVVRGTRLPVLLYHPRAGEHAEALTTNASGAGAV